MPTTDEALIRCRIERWLGRVEAHLEDRPEGEREEILADLERHGWDALASRAPAGATVAEVEAVLDEMDPPSSYGDTGPTRTAAVPAPSADSTVSGGSLQEQRTRFAVASFALFALSLTAAVVLFVLLATPAARHLRPGIDAVHVRSERTEISTVVTMVVGGTCLLLSLSGGRIALAGGIFPEPGSRAGRGCRLHSGRSPSRWL